ncbi:hypothetical protein LJC33_00550 [Eubacteriales bacterium OttesenSCG-928-N13]|nr:hypothetical protein [Eubacteriales bacterium OttesenSCG-928-N13]
MTCPRCGYICITRSLEHERTGYVAAVLCERCDRQVTVIRDDPGDAIDAADTLFYGKGGTDG